MAPERPNKKPVTQARTVRLSIELWHKIDEAARHNAVTRNHFVRMVLERAVRKGRDEDKN